MLPILVTATLYEVLNFSKANNSVSMNDPSAYFSFQPSYFEHARCDDSECYPGSIYFPFTNTSSIPITVLADDFITLTGASELLVRLLDEQMNPTPIANKVLLQPGETATAQVQYDADFRPISDSEVAGVGFFVYSCGNVQPTAGFSVDTACTFLGDLSREVFTTDFTRFVAEHHTPFAINGPHTKFSAKNLTILDAAGNNLGPKSTTTVNIAEEVIDPDSRSLLSITWQEENSGETARLTAYMQERGRRWEMVQFNLDHPALDSQVFIPMIDKASVAMYSDSPSGSYTQHSIAAPSFLHLTSTAPTVIMHGVDMTDMRGAQSPPARADIDQNGNVSIIDYSYIIASFDTQNADYDLNEDGSVNIYDYNIMVEHLGKTVEYWD